MNLRNYISVSIAAILSVPILWLALSRRGEGKTPDPLSLALEVPEAPLRSEPLQPIPSRFPLSAAKVALGRQLFHDPRLSRDDTISCASCHSLRKGGTDQLPHSRGINGAVGGINAPTVLNSGLNYRQFWNGRARTLEDQVEGPTQHPKEMGSTWPEILRKLRASPEYVAAFGKLYPEGIQRASVKEAIATFERSLVTPGAPFDRYLKGETSAISPLAKRGYQRFKELGCVSCHQGVNVGGNMYQKFGVVEDYFAARGALTEDDYGLYNQTKREEDRYFFRVPTLRNIAQTGPYFHDGTVSRLEDAVQAMARFQLGRTLEPSDAQALVAFLESLTGEYEKGADR